VTHRNEFQDLSLAIGVSSYDYSARRHQLYRWQTRWFDFLCGVEIPLVLNQRLGAGEPNVRQLEPHRH
jgi:hypothetical protein